MEEPQEPLPFGYQAVKDWRAVRLEEARREYADLMNRLWAGNGAGAVATISLIAQAGHYGTDIPSWWFWSPACFMAGLFALCVGSAIRLWDLKGIVQDLEKAKGLFDLKMDTFRTPSHHAGLHLGDPRTIAGIVASLMFVFGLVICGSAIYQVSFPPSQSQIQ